MISANENAKRVKLQRFWESVRPVYGDAAVRRFLGSVPSSESARVCLIYQQGIYEICSDIEDAHARISVGRVVGNRLRVGARSAVEDDVLLRLQYCLHYGHGNWLVHP